MNSNLKSLVKQITILNSQEIRSNLPHLKGVFSKGDTLTNLKLYLKIESPPGSLYEGIWYYVKIWRFDNYPDRKPLVKFLNKCHHPNVSPGYNTFCMNPSSNHSIVDIIFGIFQFLEKPDYFHGYSHAQTKDRDVIVIWSKTFAKSKYPDALPKFE